MSNLVKYKDSHVNSTLVSDQFSFVIISKSYEAIMSQTVKGCRTSAHKHGPINLDQDFTGQVSDWPQGRKPRGKNTEAKHIDDLWGFDTAVVLQLCNLYWLKE